MGTSNFARGNFMFGQLPFMTAGAGIRMPHGTVIPPSGRVHYVRSTGPQDGDDQNVVKRLNTTLAGALAQCRAGMGDTVFVLPGHSESVADATMLDNLVAGTRIIGVGDPRQDDAPTFRWTAAGSQWAIDDKNVLIAGLRLRLEGANGITKAINITGAGVSLIGNEIEVASGASNKATIAIEVGSGATDCLIQDNYIHGTETHNVTDLIKVVGATVPSRLRVLGNTIIASATAANGLINLTVAAKRVLIAGNMLYNTHTSSTAAIAIANAASDGLIVGNACAVMNNGTANAQGIVFTSTGSLIKCAENYNVDEPRVSGVITPAVVAT